MYNDQLLLPNWRTPEKKAIREGVDHGLLKIGEDERVVVVSADLAESVKIAKFGDTYPDRFVEVGVAEQNMAGVAAGLSFVGLIPFMASYAAFSPGRNWEQIRVSIALSRANVKVIGSHAGVSVGVNGPSHMGTEDIALMRVLPNLVVLAPADASECEAAVIAAYQHTGPVYIRTCRPDSPVFLKPREFNIGKADVLREGRDITVVACGIQVHQSMVLAESLAKIGIECEVINASSIKPIDAETILYSAEKTKRVVTIEDHQVAGGLGGAVAELLGQVGIKQLRLGINDQFGVSGKWDEVYERMGLDQMSLEKSVIDYYHDKL
jgi:transketolase